MRRSIQLLIGIVALAVIASPSIPQNALDRNLKAGGSKRNAARSTTTTATKPIYTVHRGTGEIRYNRRNAFNDQTYATHERIVFGPFDVPRTASGVPQRTSAQRAQYGTRRTTAQQQHRTTRSSGLERSTYRPKKAGTKATKKVSSRTR